MVAELKMQQADEGKKKDRCKETFDQNEWETDH